MKHSQMCLNLVSFGGVMSSPHLIEPGEIAWGDLGSDNQRAGH